MTGLLYRLGCPDIAPRPDDVEHVVARAEERVAVICRDTIVRFLDQLVEEVRRSDDTARTVSEIPRKTVERKCRGIVFDAGIFKKVVFSAGEPLERIHEEDAAPYAVGPVTPSLLPAAVDADSLKWRFILLWHSAMTSISCGSSFKRAREATPAPARHMPAPVATVGTRPPVIVPVAPDAGDDVFEKTAPDTVALPLIQCGIAPVVHHSDFVPHVARF